MKSTHLLRILAVFALLAFTPVLLFGQAVNFAQIQGRVLDGTGASLAGATVTATQVSTGLVRSASTTTDGRYALPNLPVGPYQLQVSAKGFRDYIQKGIVLQVGEQPTVNVTLQVGMVAETVEVSADASMVETHDNAISTVIDNNRIMELPLNGRNVVDLVMASGGASNTTLVSQDLLSSKNYGNGVLLNGPSQAVSVGGGQQNANNYLLDGGDNNDAFSNVNNPFPFPDAIQEFSVQSSGGSARFGVHAGAVVSAVTKSGTNAWHGSAFEYLRNPIINAHHVIFDPLPPGSKDDTMKRNQFGGTFGGPIKRDKLFVFAGFQGTRQSASAPLVSVKVPTAAALAGDWRDYFLCTGTPCLKKNLSTSLGFVGNRTTGFTIDPARYSPQALAILSHIPVSTSPTGDMSFNYPQVVNEDEGVTKFDWNISPKQTFFSRYFVTDFRSPIPFDDANILPQGQASSQFARYQSLVFSHTYTLSSSVVNSLHVTGTRLSINRGPANEMLNPTSVGINVPAPIPQGLVLSVASGYFTTGGGSQMPGHFINNLYQIADDIDIIKGRHQLSFGANFMKMQLNYLSTFQSNGQFTFSSSSISGDNLTDFLLGLPSNYVQGNAEAENWRYTYLGLYAHDNIKLRPNLTLNIGVRWEPYLPSVDIMHRGSHFDFNAFMAGTHSTVYPNAPAGLFYCGDKDIPCAFANKKWAQFSPRIGLIWDPTKKGTTTVRASYGLFYDSPEMYYFDRYADNSPFGSGVSFAPNRTAGANLANPYLGQPGTVPRFPLPFPQPGDPNAFFPNFGVYINNEFDVRPMYVQNWNLSVEKQFGPNWLVSATYLGSKTTHIWAAYEANPGTPGVTVPTNSLGCTAGIAGTGNTNCRRTLYLANPDQGKYFSNMTSLWDGADANYHALMLSARHRFAHNFTFLTNYTWSHCISDQDFSGELTNSRPTLYPSPINNPNFDNLAGDRGNCGFDVRHNWNGSLVISSPRFQGMTGRFLNNWQFAPLLSYRTGQAYDLRTGVDTALLGSTTAFKDRPNLVGDPFSGTCTRSGVTYEAGTPNCWFNPAAFVAPATGTFGTLGRNAFYGPGAFRFDAAVSRKFNITERKELQLRLEVFNVINHPVLGNPVVALNNANAGRIQTQVGDGRTFQAAVKFSF